MRNHGIIYIPRQLHPGNVHEIIIKTEGDDLVKLKKLTNELYVFLCQLYPNVPFMPAVMENPGPNVAYTCLFREMPSLDELMPVDDYIQNTYRKEP